VYFNRCRFNSCQAVCFCSNIGSLYITLPFTNCQGTVFVDFYKCFKAISSFCSSKLSLFKNSMQHKLTCHSSLLTSQFQYSIWPPRLLSSLKVNMTKQQLINAHYDNAILLLQRAINLVSSSSQNILLDSARNLIGNYLARIAIQIRNPECSGNS